MATSLTSFEDEPRTGPQKDAAPWAELLNKAIESEILPRLLAANRATSPDHNIDVTGFVALIIADDMEQIRATADRVIVLTGSRDASGFAAAADAAAADVDPIADVRGSRAYKREMVRVHVQRALVRASAAEDR